MHKRFINDRSKQVTLTEFESVETVKRFPDSHSSESSAEGHLGKPLKALSSEQKQKTLSGSNWENWIGKAYRVKLESRWLNWKAL